MGCRTGVALSMSRSAVTLKTKIEQALAKLSGSQCGESCSADQPAALPPADPSTQLCKKSPVPSTQSSAAWGILVKHPKYSPSCLFHSTGPAERGRAVKTHRRSPKSSSSCAPTPSRLCTTVCRLEASAAASWRL